jgi:hypothetical protein
MIAASVLIAAVHALPPDGSRALPALEFNAGVEGA